MAGRVTKDVGLKFTFVRPPETVKDRISKLRVQVVEAGGKLTPGESY